MATNQPNILLILTDDWGYGDLGCYGHPAVQTPNLDQLAQEGLRFRQFHVTSPVCSPSRCSFLTGHYPARHGIHGHLARYDLNAQRSMVNWLDPDVETLPRRLQQAGYRTAHYGKWHLGGGGGIHGHPDAPMVRDYGYDHTRTWNGNGPTWYQTEPWPFTLHNDVDRVWVANSSRLAVDAAIEFIGQERRPFFINLWLKDPHLPLHPTEEQRAPYAHLAEPEQTYYSVLTDADRQIGRLLRFLSKRGLADDTLVIFTSDNGPENYSEVTGAAGSTGGLRGRKRSLYEGGICVPFLLRWPGKAPAGAVSDALVSAVDLYPTLLHIAGVSLPEGHTLDGVDVTEAFHGAEFTRPLPLMWQWRFPKQDAEDFWPMRGIRHGDHVLVDSPQQGRCELYDLRQDPGQRQDRAAALPDLAQSLRQQLEKWEQAL